MASVPPQLREAFFLCAAALQGQEPQDSEAVRLGLCLESGPVVQEEGVSCPMMGHRLQGRTEVLREKALGKGQRAPHISIRLEVNADGSQMAQGDESVVPTMAHTEVQGGGCGAGRLLVGNQLGFSVRSDTQRDAWGGDIEEGTQLPPERASTMYETRTHAKIGESCLIDLLLGRQQGEKRIRVGTAIHRHHPDPFRKIQRQAASGQAEGRASTYAAMRCTACASGSRPAPPPRLSIMLTAREVAGVTQVTAGCARQNLRKN